MSIHKLHNYVCRANTFARLVIDIEVFYKLVGDRVQRSRKGKLSQAKLAAALGLSRSSIVNIEAGRQHAPLHVLWRIAEVLQTDLPMLIPDKSAFDGASAPTSLTDDELQKIEKAAEGDPQTRRQLEEALQRVGRKDA